MQKNSFDRTDLQQVIAIVNGKGGIGKTTLSANIAGLLAASGWRVLVVDLDGQGNLGLDLGYAETERDDDGEALSKALIFGEEPKPVKDVRPNLDVLPGGRHLDAVSSTMQPRFAKPGRDGKAARLALASALAQISGEYDMVILDCPPKDDVLQSLAVAAARFILIPARTDRGSLKGLKLTADRLEDVEDINPDVDLLGVVLFDSSHASTRIRREFIAEVERDLGATPDDAIVFESFVRNGQGTATAARNKGMLVHEVEDAVKKSPKWFEALKSGAKPENAGPRSAGTVAESMQAVAQELVARFTSKQESADV